MRQYLVLAAALVLTLASCARPKQPQDQIQAQNEYVDTRVCASCHKDIARTYAATGMARSFYAPNTASIPNSKPYFHTASSTWYQIVPKAGGWVQRWWLVDAKGRAESVGESKIDYVMGSGNHVRTYLHRTARNTLIELPLAWYAEKGGSWALNPGLDESDPPIGRKVGYDCMFCHNSYPTILSGHDDPGSEPVFASMLPQGIDCQRCHGPGGNHVKAVAQLNAKIEDIRSAIVNPARLNPQRSMEVCMQCHLETTSAPLPSVIRRYDRGPFSYRPGEPLSSFQFAFDHAPGTGREGKFEIVNAAYRLRQSECFLKSNQKLGCTTCHNPHDIQHGKQADDGYNKACTQCHAPAQLAGQTHPANPDCISCHMPKRRTEDVVHAVMTDHLIQRRPPANLLAEFPERHGPGLQWTEYRGEVVPSGDRDDLYTAVAQVTHKSNLDAGIPRLQSAITKQKPEHSEFYLELGDALQRSGRSEEASASYRDAIAKQPGSARLQARLAQALRAQGKSQEPLDAMRKSVQLDPNDAENWYNLALLQSELGDKKSAIDSFQKSIALDSEFADSRNALGIALAEIGQPAEAETQIRGALTLRPAFASAHAYLGFLLANRGEYAEAVSHFDRGGDTAFNQLNYGITLARMNRTAEAARRLEKSLQVNPNQPVAQELLGELLESQHKIPDATHHYESAIRLNPDFGRARVQLGASLLRQGDRHRASEQFQAAQSDSNPQIREIAIRGLAAASR